MKTLFPPKVIAILAMYFLGFLMGVLTGPTWFALFEKQPTCLEYEKVGAIDSVPSGYLVTMTDKYQYLQDKPFKVDYICKTK